MKFVEKYQKFGWWFKNSGLPERAAMNALQNAGIISDECVFAADVADADYCDARDFLKAEFCPRCKKPVTACFCGGGFWLEN